MVALKPFLDLSVRLEEGWLAALGVGWDRQVYVALGLKPPDLRDERTRGASFPKPVPDEPQDYRILAFQGNENRLNVVVREEPFNISLIQPLGENLLLASARCRYRAGGMSDRNGRAYSRQGRLVHDLCLGDGIQDLQSTKDGRIWASYFDEGIFGNFGWSQPIGASGLIEFDSAGQVSWSFQPPAGHDTMCDCYALNVESALDAWCYYYTEFPLVQIRDRKAAGAWQVPVKGSDAFAIRRHHVVFRGGYQERDVYHLVELSGDGKARLVGTFRLSREDGQLLQAEHVCARGDSLTLLRSGKLYRLDVAAVLPLFDAR